MEELCDFELLEEMSQEIENKDLEIQMWKARFFEERKRAERAELKLFMVNQDLVDCQLQLRECENIFLADIEKPSLSGEAVEVDQQQIELTEEIEIQPEEFEFASSESDADFDDQDYFFRPLPTIVEENPDEIPDYYEVCESYLESLKIVIGSDTKENYGKMMKDENTMITIHREQSELEASETTKDLGDMTNDRSEQPKGGKCRVELQVVEVKKKNLRKKFKTLFLIAHY